jgi:hypothetical protein
MTAEPRARRLIAYTNNQTFATPEQVSRLYSLIQKILFFTIKWQRNRKDKKGACYVTI